MQHIHMHGDCNANPFQDVKASLAREAKIARILSADAAQNKRGPVGNMLCIQDVPSSASGLPFPAQLP